MKLSGEELDDIGEALYDFLLETLEEEGSKDVFLILVRMFEMYCEQEGLEVTELLERTARMFREDARAKEIERKRLN